MGTLSLWIKSDLTALEITLEGNELQRLEGIREFIECETAERISLPGGLVLWVDEDARATERETNYVATFIVLALSHRQPVPLRGPAMVTRDDGTPFASLRHNDVALLQGYAAMVRELANGVAPGHCPVCNTPEADKCSHKGRLRQSDSQRSATARHDASSRIPPGKRA